jgi:MAGUK p55 subfamily protein 5
LAENSHVQDAFVIAVEQQAKERLERLSALRKIKPVDMTLLSQEVSIICISKLIPEEFVS